MGNSNGKDKSEEMVDGGQLVPHGLYKGPQDWDTKSVRKFIIERKLAPFYKGLSDYDDNWDDVTLTTHNLPKNGAKELKRTGTLNSTGTNKGKEINSMKTLETQLYKGAVECPICFLYYPQNINHSRCCDQPICTECFVQIKRPENGTLGANNSPAVCPFCVEPNFGVCYKPPPFSNGIGSENVTLHTTIQNNNSSPSLPSTNTSFNTSSSDSKSRRKSVSHKDPEVVTSDQIRPDWATRVVLQPVRQPLSPRRLQNLNSPGNPRRFVPRPNPPTGAIVPPSASTNSRRNLTPDADYSRYLAAMRMGTDLEELMVMEAIRLSLVEQEVAQRREREERDRSNNNSQESSNTISSQNEENETNNIRVNDIDDGNDDDGDDDDDDDDDGLLTPRRLGLNGDEDDEDEGEEDLTSHSLENTSTIVSTPITTGTEDETITSTSAQSSPVSTNSINDHQQINTSLSLPLPPPPPPPPLASSSSPSSATTTATATATDSITVTETEIGTITETTAETTTTKPVATTTSINAHNVDSDNDNVTTTTIIEEIRLINRNDDQEISPPPPLITTSENDG